MNRIKFNMLYYLIIVFLLASCATMPLTIHQQPIPNEHVSKSSGILNSSAIGGEGLESGMGITCAQNGSCLLFGETNGSFGYSTDYLAIMMSPDQKIAWAKTYGGRDHDRGLSAISASDGGYLLIGVSKSMLFTPLPGDRPYYPLIIKIDPIGNIQWARAIEYFSETNFYIYNVTQTTDNGYVFSGYDQGAGEDNVLFKLSENGDFLWRQQFFIGNGQDIFQPRVIETTEQNLAILFGADKMLGLFVTDSQGKPLWGKTYENENTQFIRSPSLVNDGKGGIVMVAMNYSGGENNEPIDIGIAVTNITSQGDVLWSQQYNAGSYSVPVTIVKDYNNGFVIVGVTGESVLSILGILGIIDKSGYYDESTDAFMLSIDSKGQEKFSFVSAFGSMDALRAVSIAQDKYFLLGDDISQPEVNFLLSTWQPHDKETNQTDTAMFTSIPFTLTATAVEVEVDSIELDTMKIGENLSVRELIVGSLMINQSNAK